MLVRLSNKLECINVGAHLMKKVSLMPITKQLFNGDVSRESIDSTLRCIYSIYMETIKLKAFRSGNSLALRIPASLNLGVDDEFSLTQSVDGTVVIQVNKVTSREEQVKALYDLLEKEGEVWNDIERPQQGEREVSEW